MLIHPQSAAAAPPEAAPPEAAPAPIPKGQRAGSGAASSAALRLRKHADYQRVYAASRKQFGKQMSYFFAPRQPHGTLPLEVECAVPRVGLTVGKVMGKAVDRNRIKRRMREAVRLQRSLLQAPVDVVLHPRRSVIDLEFVSLEREVAAVFRAIQRASERQAASAPPTAR